MKKFAMVLMVVVTVVSVSFGAYEFIQNNQLKSMVNDNAKVVNKYATELMKVTNTNNISDAEKVINK